MPGNRLGRPAYVGIFTDNARLDDMRHVCLSIHRGELLIEFLNRSSPGWARVVGLTWAFVMAY